MSLRSTLIVWLAAALFGSNQASQAQGSKCGPEIAVTFELRDLRHVSRYNPPEIAALEAEVRSVLLAALNRRYLHLHFTEAAQDHTLQCVFNTGTKIDDPRQATFKSDAVSWHFRLVGPSVPEPSVSWEYAGLDAYNLPLPDSALLLSNFRNFLDEPAGSDAEQKTAADNRFAKLFGGVLGRIPILTGRPIQHIKSTRLLVIPSPRRDFHCSLPDLSEFAVEVELKNGLLSQPHNFLAQLIGAGRVEEFGDVLGDQLKDALVTEAIAPLKDTTKDHLDQLKVGEAHDVSLLLWRPGVADFSCLNTSVEDFDPASGSQ